MSGTSSLLVLGALLALSCCNPQLHVAADGIEGVDNVITQWNAVAQRVREHSRPISRPCVKVPLLFFRNMSIVPLVPLSLSLSISLSGF